MNKNHLIAFAVIIGLATIYWNTVLFLPGIVQHSDSDLLGDVMLVKEKMLELRSGFLAVGDFWVNRGGGFPAVPEDWITHIPHLVALGFNGVGFDPNVAVKLALFAFTILGGIGYYLYGFKLLQDESAALIVAVGVIFSSFFFGQLEHLSIYAGACLLSFFLLALECLIEDARIVPYRSQDRFIYFAGFTGILVAFTEMRMAILVLPYILIRLYYRGNKTGLINCLKSGMIAGTFSLILYFPQFLHLSTEMPDEISRYSIVNAVRLFVKPTPTNEVLDVYVSAVLFLLALVPLFKKDMFENREHRIQLLTGLIFLALAFGSNSPINLMQMLRAFPLAWAFRVPSRMILIFHVSIAVAGAIGLIVFKDKIPFKPARLLTVGLVVGVLFFELAVPLMPTPVALPTAPKAYDNLPFTLKELDVVKWVDSENVSWTSGTFQLTGPEGRIVEIPALWSWNLAAHYLTGLDVLTHQPPRYGTFPPSLMFAEQYHNFIALKKWNQTDLAREAALYGVQYVMVHYPDPVEKGYKESAKGLIQRLENESVFKKIYDDKETAVFENPQYAGEALAVDALSKRQVTAVNCAMKDRFYYVLEGEYPSPKNVSSFVVVLSQGYDHGWMATLNGVPVDTFNYEGLIGVWVQNTVPKPMNFSTENGYWMVFYDEKQHCVMWQVSYDDGVTWLPAERLSVAPFRIELHYVYGDFVKWVMLILFAGGCALLLAIKRGVVMKVPLMILGWATVVITFPLRRWDLASDYLSTAILNAYNIVFSFPVEGVIAQIIPLPTRTLMWIGVGFILAPVLLVVFEHIDLEVRWMRVTLRRILPIAVMIAVAGAYATRSVLLSSLAVILFAAVVLNEAYELWRSNAI